MNVITGETQYRQTFEAGKESVVLSEDGKVYENCRFTGHLSARVMHEDGRPYHTFRTASLLVQGNHITFRNCLFENTAGPGKEVGQAIALYLDGEDIRLENCIIRGNQDTLFLAPLPEKEREKDGFIGPGQFLPRTNRTFSFKNCLIEGGVDFIFGGASARFTNCEFRSVEPGFIFAPSTPEHVECGFVAENCRFTAVEGLTDGSCYIARPWREYGMVRISHCELGPHIHPDLWCDWADAMKEGKARFTLLRK